MSLLSLVAAALVAIPSVAPIPEESSQATATPKVDVVIEWYDTTVSTIASAGAPAQVTNSRTWAIGWLAAARALRHGKSTPQFDDAALASAVHTSLTSLIPTRKAELDAALSTTLARIPDGQDKRKGVAAGAEEAEALLAERAGDGLDPASVSPPFQVPAPGPGVWQTTPPEYAAAAQSGTRFARPFLLDRADRYRPAPPPALDSARYRRDLAEVRVYGALDSSQRTQAQTDTAQFWLGSSLTLYNDVLRGAVEQSRESMAWRARLVAIFHVASVDTQIATSDAKYAYLRWRPVTALQAEYPGWTPLHTTPAHPDYPSGHNTYSGSAEGVLTALVGPHSERPYTVTSPSQPGATRTYTTWKRPTDENIDARVWSGIHTRSADLAGAELGQDVAAYVVRNAGKLFR
jgi:hypothetical protein